MVFVSRELARLGHRVEVYNECADGDLGLDAHGVRWLRHATYDHTTPPDVFVAWRYHISTALAGADRPKRIYAWLQDVPGYDSWTPDFVEGLSGIFTLSKFHTRTLPAHARYKARETPNGIDLSFIVEGDNRWDVFAYGSAPNRGLYDVLRIWPAVRERLPNATLVVYPLAAPNIFGSPRNTSASSPRFGLCGHYPRHLARSLPGTTGSPRRSSSGAASTCRASTSGGRRSSGSSNSRASRTRAWSTTRRPRRADAFRERPPLDRSPRKIHVAQARGVAAIRPRRPAGPHHPVSSSS